MKEHDASGETHRHWALFKTAKGRVSFLVVSTAGLTLGAVGYGAWELYRVQGAKIEFGAHEQWVGVTTAGLLLGALVIAKVLGNVLIARKVRRLAEVAAEVAEGTADPRTLPYGLGELDGFTRYLEKVSTESRQLKATMEKQVRIRTGELEVSKGMSDLDKARSEALIASIAEGVVAIDNEGKVTFMNEVAKRALWWNPEKAMGLPVHSAFRLEDEKEKDMDEAGWPTTKVLAERLPVTTSAPTHPFYLRRADKSRFPVKMTVSPLSVQGEPAGALLTIADITVEVDFDRRKSEFISIAAHQLRSPATGIKMMTLMMRDGSFGAVTEKQQEWMGKLYNASDTLIDLVGELLNVSRLESGSEIDKAPQDLAEFTKGVLKLTEPLLVSKKQAFAVETHGNGNIAFDRLMIGEVMKNFLSNAHKYSPEGSTITVTTELADGKARFAVKDSGMGIPKADQAKMFNKFFRAGNAAQSPIVGTGLGLYYCKTVVEKHGGEIGFDSQEGMGSTFWFTLPA